MNALTFWVYSPVLFDNEEKAVYEAILLRLEDEYKPIGYSEQSVIRDLALYDLKMIRISAMEEFFNGVCEMDNVFELTDRVDKFSENAMENKLTEPLIHYYMRWSSILKYKNIDHLWKIQEYRNTIERGKERCLNQLMRIKGFKKIYS